MPFTRSLLLLLLMALCASARRSCPTDTSIPLEKRVRDVPLVFHGLPVQTDQSATLPVVEGLNSTAQFWIITVYKGSRLLAEFFHLDEQGTDAVGIKDR